MDGGASSKGSVDELLDMALGLNPNNRSLSSSPARGPSRFVPRTKGKSVVKAEPDGGARHLPSCAASLLPEMRQEAKHEAASVAKEGRPDMDGITDLTVDWVNTEAMEVDPIVEDYVVREIDVFCNPSLDEGSQLCVMQYPLRPSWRPYELNERCNEVRVNPKVTKVEVDLSLDVDGQNYDQEVVEPLRLKKQTLCSSEAPMATRYAIGILIGDKLYLNAIHAIFQLRPSMGYVQKMAKKAVSAQEKLPTEDDPDNEVEAESWISLEYYPLDHPLSGRYHKKMVFEVQNQVLFNMKGSDYLDSLCPGTPFSNKKTVGSAISMLLKMPLEERLKSWFSEEPKVNTFDAVMHLAPDVPADDVLKVLPNYADLVQGLWVSKSSLLYNDERALARDYFLFLFSKSFTVSSSKIREIACNSADALLQQFAVHRPSLNDWKFLVAPDLSFAKRYSHVSEKQRAAWSSRENDFRDILLPQRKAKLSTTAGASSKAAVTGRGGHIANGNKDGTNTSGTSKQPAKELSSSRNLTSGNKNLVSALWLLFQRQAVCSPSGVTEGLRHLAIVLMGKRKDSEAEKVEKLITAAKYGGSVPPDKLHDVLIEETRYVHGLYVFVKKKKDKEFSVVPMREAIVEFFLTKPDNLKFRKQDILQFARTRQENFRDQELDEALGDLCVCIDGKWRLKSGDWIPK